MVTRNFITADWTIYENDGSGKFVNPRTLPAISAGSCAVLHDRDRDGDLDMTGIDELADQLFLFENSGATSVREPKPAEVPTEFELLQSYPNPFMLSVHKVARITLPFTLTETARVKLEVINLKGQRVALLLDSQLSAGDHAVTLPTRNLPAGIYFYRLAVLRLPSNIRFSCAVKVQGCTGSVGDKFNSDPLKSSLF